MSDTQTFDPLEILSREYTAKLLGFSLSTLDRQSGIPRVRLSTRRWGYRRADIAAWQAARLETPGASRSDASETAE